MRSDSLPSSHCLGDGLILNKSVSFIGFHGRNFDLDVANIAKLIENFPEMGLGVVGRLIFDRCIDNRD